MRYQPRHPMTLAIAAVACCLVPATASAHAASTAPDDQVERAYRFELRAMGAKAGDAVLTIGALGPVGEKVLRPVRLEGRTTGVAARLFGFAADATSWLDGAWFPVAAGWKGDTDAAKRRVKATFPGNHTRGEYRKNGKLLYRVDVGHEVRPLDAVSAFAWLLHAELEPGAVLDRPLYDGRKIYRFEARVGEPREIAIPMGVRNAWPVKIRISREDFERRVTYWVGVEDRLPCKFVFDYGLLGRIEAILTSKRERREG